MATISTSNNEKLFRLDTFYGVNESPDGDTGLRMGDAAISRNFRVTKDGNLQIRTGYTENCTLSEGHQVRGIWSGYVGGTRYLLAACNGHIWNVNTSTWSATDIGALTDAPTHFFPFASNVYILNGVDYYKWTGTGSIAAVAGYAPIVATATPPAGGGTLLEAVNKLTGQKRQQFSPDGTLATFQLAETAITSVDVVKLNGAVQTLTTHYTVNSTTGVVTFTSTPTAGTNTVEITWTKETGDRATIVAQKFSEMYNGSTDNRIFLYGNGTNKAYYSGLDENGQATAEYFPDLNVLDVGTSNTPITSLIRHYNQLLAFKSDSTFLVDYDYITLSNGTVTAGFYTKAIDKDTGNIAPAQVKMVNNFPVSLHGNSAYRWSLFYSSGTQDERQAKRISDNVGRTLGGLSLSSAITWDDDYRREFWIVQNGTACVWNYSGEVDAGQSYTNNSWYIYTDIPATCFTQIGGTMYFGTADGTLCAVDENVRSDKGTDIDAYWESGSMSFGTEYLRKFLNRIHTVLKPDVNARITVTLETDRKSDFDEKVIGSGVLNFAHIDFAHWSFLLNDQPHTAKTKLKAKKFTTLKLIFKSQSSSATATIMSCVLHITDTGEAK